MQALIQAISDKAYLDQQLLATIQQVFERVEYKRKDKLMQLHQTAKYLYFVEEGVLHSYYYHADKAVTSWFYTEHQFITAWHSFYAQQSSFEEIACLENLRII